MKQKSIVWRTALFLMALTFFTSSYTLTLAKYVWPYTASSTTFGVYNLLPAFTHSSTAWGSARNAITVKCENAPAGEWAFFARGQHGRDKTGQNSCGKPGVFLGIYRKTSSGFFTIGTITGGDRSGSSGGSGGIAAFIFDDIARPTSNPGNTNGFVCVAGGGGGQGGDDNQKGGDAGGQTGVPSGWNYVNGVPNPSPDYPTWSEIGFVGGWQGNNGNKNNQAQTTSNNGSDGAGGGGGAGVTGGRAIGGNNGRGSDKAGWFSGHNGTAAGSGGGGGAGIWGGGGGGGLVFATGRSGGGGSSYSAAIAAVPAAVANPVTYREFAIRYFWSLVGDRCNAGTFSSNINSYDGTVILVWLGP